VNLLDEKQGRRAMLTLLGKLLFKIRTGYRSAIAHSEISQERAVQLATSKTNLVIQFNAQQIEFALNLIETGRTNEDDEVFPAQAWEPGSDDDGEQVADEPQRVDRADSPSESKKRKVSDSRSGGTPPR
jgi:hypothetical protein